VQRPGFDSMQEDALRHESLLPACALLWLNRCIKEDLFIRSEKKICESQH